jgi:outer membrane protein assembly complex protein YaeT
MRAAAGALTFVVGLLPSIAAHGQEPVAAAAPSRRLEVRSLRFEGVESIDESALRAALGTRESPWLPWRDVHHFDQAQFERDLTRIVSFYADRGYPGATIVSHDVGVERDAVDIRIVVDEGKPLRVAAVELENFDVLPDRSRDALVSALPLEPGDPLDLGEAARSRQLAVEALGDHGYPFAEVSADRREAPGGARVVLRANPGQQSFFGPIHISGNSGVDDEIVRRALAYRPGELFRATRIRQSLRQLSALELFRDADIGLEPADASSVDVPTRVTVVERNPNRFEVSGGFGSDEMVHGEVAWRHVNFFGDGRKAGARARMSWLDSGVEATFLQPYFLSPRLSLGVRGQAWLVDEQAFRAVTRGGQATLARSLGPDATVSATLSQQFQRSRIADEAIADSALREELIALGLDPMTGEQAGRLSALTLEGVLLKVDEPLSPARGYAATLRLEQAGGWLPGTYRYFSVIGDLRAYFTPRERVTVAVRARHGSIDPFGPDSDVPFFKRFFVGGATSLRGWGRSQVAPLSSTGLPIGGHSMFETSAELRITAWNGLGVAAFVDAGKVWRDRWTARLGDLLYDAGPGVRYAAPFGLVRIDFAYQLNRLEGLRIDSERQTSRWRVQLGIGHAF